MTKNRQFHFYQQTKNCQLTDDRILLTEKTFHFNLLRHHYSRFFTHVPDDALSSPVILNGGKNALWKNQETER